MFRPLDPRLARLRLVAITDARLLGGWAETEAAAARALAAGLPALMLREPDSTITDTELLPIAQRLALQARSEGALLLVNSRLGLAIQCQAAGLHLGSRGPSLAIARRRLGDSFLIGYSAHEETEALNALDAGADYVTFSPVFPTPSKAGLLEPVGLERLAALAACVPGRVIALGGIDFHNTITIHQAGAAGVAVIRAIFGAEDVAMAVKELQTAFLE